MTLAELHRNFKIELDKSSISSYPSFLPEEIDYWLNTAILRIIKTRYSGLNAHQKGFQQNQKRTDDLRLSTKISNYPTRTFVVNTAYLKDEIVIGVDGQYYTANASHTASNMSLFTKTSIDDNSLWVNFPEDYITLVGESVNIYSNNTCWPKVSDIPKRKRSDILEATIENFDSKLENSLSEYHLHSNKAKPIRLISENKIKLYTDGAYFIDKYSMEYISTPDKLDWYKYIEYNKADAIEIDEKFKLNGNHYISSYRKNAGDDIDMTKVSEVLLDSMPPHMWDEVTVLSVRLALENITEPRYQTYSQESQMIE